MVVWFLGNVHKKYSRKASKVDPLLSCPGIFKVFLFLKSVQSIQYHTPITPNFDFFLLLCQQEIIEFISLKTLLNITFLQIQSLKTEISLSVTFPIKPQVIPSSIHGNCQLSFLHRVDRLPAKSS